MPAAPLSLAMESASSSIAETSSLRPAPAAIIGQSYEVGGDSWPEPELTAQLRRLLKVAARFVELAAAMFGDPKVPQRVRQGQRIVCLGRECTGSLERRNRGCIIVPYDLVKRADPELPPR